MEKQVGSRLQNRYQLLRLLGRGSMGEVFLAADSRQEEEVALKIVPPQWERAGHLKDEFRLLSHLSHPHLAQVYDFGTLEDGSCFYTMEYVEGISLWEATEEVDYEEFYLWLVQLCRTLEYLHSRGYVHCDLKPHNIMITSRREVKLMDFGLAILKQDDLTGGARGTLAYMAPEMAKGIAVDHRADLYSMGAVLYHVLTREPLFQSEKPLGLIQKHLETPPLPPRQKNPQIPVLLEETILKLLAKEPGERFQNANEIILEINLQGNFDFPLETEATLKSSLSSSRLVGRREEMEKLKEIFQKRFGKEDRVEAPTWVLLTGPEGIGKSRLLREFKWMVQLRDVRAVSVDLRESEGIPYEPFIEILRELIGEENIADFPDEFRPYLHKILKGELPPEGTPKKLREDKEPLRFYFKVSEFLVWKGESSPYVLLLDNLQNAREHVLELLNYLAKLAEEAPLLIVSAFRDQSSFLELLRQDMELERLTRVLPLASLKEEEVKEWVDITVPLKRKDRDQLLTFLGAAGGNVLLLEELLKSLLEEEILYYQKGQWKLNKEELAQFRPSLELSHLFKQRFANLDEKSFYLLKIAAALSRPVSRELFQKVTDFPLEEINSHLHKLRQNHFLYEDYSRPGWFQFSSQRLLEVVMEVTSHQERKELHLKIAQGLLHFYSEENAPLEELGKHFLRGGEKDRALEYLLKAARKGSRVYAHRKALNCYQFCLEVLDERDERRFEIREEMARLYNQVGELSKATEIYFDLLEDPAFPNHRKGEIYHRLGKVYRRLGNHRRAQEIYLKALEHLSEEEGELQGEVRADLAWELASSGRFDEAQEEIDRGFDYIEEENSSAMANLYNSLMALHYYRGQISQASEAGEKALAIQKKREDTSGIALYSNNLAVLYKEKGLFERAIEVFESALEISRRIGDIKLTASIVNNLGSLYQERGDFSKGLDLLKESLDIKLKLGNPAGIAGSLNNIGFLLYWQGEYGKALEYYHSSLKIEEELGNNQGIVLTLNNLAALYIEVGMFEEAAGYLDKAQELEKDMEIPIQKAYSQRLRARIDLAGGASVPAFHRMEEALSIMEEGSYMTQLALTYLDYAQISLSIRDYHRARMALRRTRELANATDSRLIEVHLHHYEALVEASPHEKLRKLEEAASSLEEIRLPELEWKNWAALAREKEGRGELKEALNFYRRSLKAMKEVYRRLPLALRNSYVKKPERAGIRENFIQLNSRILARESDFFFSEISTFGDESPSFEGEFLSPTVLAELHQSLENYSQGAENLLQKALKMGKATGGALFRKSKKKARVEAVCDLEEERVREISSQLGEKEIDGEVETLPGKGESLSYVFPLYLPSQEGTKPERERREVSLENRKQVGLLYLECGGELSLSREKLLIELARHGALALKNASLYRDSNTDSLTGLFDGRAMEKKLRREWRKAREGGSFLSLLFLDLKNFRQINRSLGYTGGDQILKELSRRFKKVLRARDFSARYGGDVFAFILPDTNATQARICGEKLLGVVGEFEFRNTSIQARVGGATYPMDALQYREFLIRAKQALGAAKEQEDPIALWKWDYSEYPSLPALTTSLPQVARVVFDTIRELPQFAESRPALSRIFDTLLELTNLERAFLLIPTEEEGLQAVWGRARPHKNIEPRQFSSTVPEKVFQSRQALWLIDTGVTRQGKRTLSMERFSLSTALAFPLIRRGRPRGVIYLDASFQARRIVEDDLPYLELLANQASLFMAEFVEGEKREGPPLNPGPLLMALEDREEIKEKISLLYRFARYLEWEEEDCEELLLAFLAGSGEEDLVPSRSFAHQIAQEWHRGKPPLSQSALILRLVESHWEKGEVAQDFPDRDLAEKFIEFSKKISKEK